MRKWLKSVGATATYEGREFPADTIVEVMEDHQICIANSPGVLAAIDNGTLEVVYNGTDSIDDPTRAKAFIRAYHVFPSSHAVDKNETAQTITTTSTTKITALRILWDTIEEYDLENSRFYPAVDGIWNLNGTVTFSDLDNVARARIHVYRNDELWFTVADVQIGLENVISIPFSCDVDAYASEGHYFDLRIELTKSNSLLGLSATVSGDDEKTAWGMSFLHILNQDPVV